jgi:hypothetical protein
MDLIAPNLYLSSPSQTYGYPNHVLNSKLAKMGLQEAKSILGLGHL